MYITIANGYLLYLHSGDQRKKEIVIHSSVQISIYKNRAVAPTQSYPQSGEAGTVRYNVERGKIL